MIRCLFSVYLFLIYSVSSSVFNDDLFDSVLDEEMCNRQLSFLVNDSVLMEFIDASGKFPSGILSGNLDELGDYHECLGIRKKTEDFSIEGKYCIIVVPLNLGTEGTRRSLREYYEDVNEALVTTDDSLRAIKEITGHFWNNHVDFERKDRRNIRAAGALPDVSGLKLAACVPKVCNVTQVINSTLFPFIDLPFSEKYCRLPNDKPLVTGDYIAIFIFSLIGLITVASTSYDLYYIFQLNRETNRIYSSFSLYTNTQRLLNFKSSPGTIECLDGLRTISMFWVVVGHTFILSFMGPVHNARLLIGNWFTEFPSFWLKAAPISVDTFFMLSGVLCVYTTIGKIDRLTFVKNIPLFYLHRLLRMFPLLATMILIHATLLNHISDGPNWHALGTTIDACRKYWWSALLHIQNYYNVDNMCLSQTWYLSVDIQLYIVCPIVLVWLFGPKFTAWCAMTTAMLLSLVSVSYYTFTYNFSASMVNLARIDEVADYTKIYYFNTLTRASPFFVGMMYGYLFHLTRNKEIRISKPLVCFLWILSFLIMAVPVFGIHPVSKTSFQHQWVDNVMNAYMRAGWAAALGWLIFACNHGYGGPINWFLSLPMWKLPSRLSYGVYIVHFSIIMIADASWVKSHYITVADAMYRFMSDLTLSFLASFFLCLVIDAPFSTLQKILFGEGKRQKKKTGSLENIVDDKTRDIAESDNT